MKTSNERDQPTVNPSTSDAEGGTTGGGHRRNGLLLLGALGVVYGDIGTSPLYAMREAFTGPAAAPTTEAGVLGVASLVVWSLLAVVAIKYVLVVMRADDHGEGGIIALQNLATRGSKRPAAIVRAMTLMGLFGTALLYGDGMITPAISVLSAVEGLEVVTPALSRFVLPISVGIIVALFLVQPRGTNRIGAAFGPVMVLWFAFLAVTGLRQIVMDPSVLQAFSPVHGIRYLLSGHGVATLGAVFLVVTGSEALYADMGHFGHRPIARSWWRIVFPALILQYLGQAALILRDPGVTETVFYRMVPAGLLPAAVLLATLATIIASQALISGAFSLTAQAVQLGFLPRMRIVHTSDREIGQVYVPAVNWGLMVAAIALVVGFGSSTRLASAYGVAVVLTMLITSLLFAVVARDSMGWRRRSTWLVTVAFVGVDVLFLVANVDKIPSGGWFPLLVGGVLVLIMRTWIQGRRLVTTGAEQRDVTLESFLASMDEDPPDRVAGTSTYLYGVLGAVPPALRGNLRRNHVLHEELVLVAVVIERQATVPPERRTEVRVLGHGIVQIIVRFGFADQPDVPTALAAADHPEFHHATTTTWYVLGFDEVVAKAGTGMALWRERLFVAMRRNAARPTAHFNLPPERVVLVGRRVDI